MIIGDWYCDCVGGRAGDSCTLITPLPIATYCRFQPYTTFEKCRICKLTVHQAGSHYCQGKPHKKDTAMASMCNNYCVPPSLLQVVHTRKVCTSGSHCMHPSHYTIMHLTHLHCPLLRTGICAMCGKKILDVKNYKQSST